MPEQDYISNFRYQVDMGLGVPLYFSEVDGLSVKIKPIEYCEAGANPLVRKLAGRTEYGHVTFRWGMTEATAVWDWLLSGVNGEVERRDISVILLKPTGEEYFRYNLQNAWACEWNAGKFEAMGQGVAIETLVVAHEGLVRA